MAGDEGSPSPDLISPLLTTAALLFLLMGGAHTEGPMPLARIITKSADDSLELSMQLRVAWIPGRDGCS